jgi:adenylosuccinate lyase
MMVWEGIQQARLGLSFRERLEADLEVSLNARQLDELFDLWGFLERIGVIFERLEKLE